MEEEQALVARLLHRLHSDDVDQHFAVLNAARERLQRGGPRRMRHTLPALAFCTLRCVREITSGRAKAAKVGQAGCMAHCDLAVQNVQAC